MHKRMSVRAQERQCSRRPEASDPLKWEGVSHPTWVLRLELGFFARAASALNHEPFSPIPR